MLKINMYTAAKLCPSFLVNREEWSGGWSEGWRVERVGESRKVWSQWRLGQCGAELEPYYHLGGGDRGRHVRGEEGEVCEG